METVKKEPAPAEVAVSLEDQLAAKSKEVDELKLIIAANKGQSLGEQCVDAACSGIAWGAGVTVGCLAVSLLVKGLNTLINGSEEPAVDTTEA